jgi:hypothetical protein
MTAMQEFLDDYGPGKAQGRYVDAELPTLPFADTTFDLALCSHFLFLYASQLDESFHRSAIREMCRIAAEVRIFPLLALGGGQSPYVAGTVGELRDSGFDVTIETVPYEFRRGGNRMMRIHKLGKTGANGIFRAL